MNIIKAPNNLKDFALFIRKCLDLPSISKEDLIFFLSFQLFILKPSKAIQIVNELIKKEFLVENMGKLTLSNLIMDSFNNWQQEEDIKVKQAMEEITDRAKVLINFDPKKKISFNMLLKELTDEKTLDRAVSISKNSFNDIEINFNQGLIKGGVKGTMETPYYIEIDIKKKKISHDCHDFVSKKSSQKLFCKHIIKLFLIIKSKNEEKLEGLFRNIIKEKDKWDFA